MNRSPALVLFLGAAHVCTAASLAETAMTEIDPHAITVNAEGMSLGVRFDYTPDGNRLRLRYRLVNTGNTALVVFDRGAAVGSRIIIGFPVPPVESGGITLDHLPEPAPEFESGRSGPYAPNVPLAARVEPGSEHVGLDQVNPPDGAERVRYCLGVAEFDAARYRPYDLRPTDETGVTLWRAPYREEIESLTVLCSPWFDLKAGRFD